MRWDCILENESPNELAVRLNRPLCMIMRANGLFSTAWLLPGREILVPDGECGGVFPCPGEAFHRLAGLRTRVIFARIDDTWESVSRRTGLTKDELRQMNGFEKLYAGMMLRTDGGNL